MPLKSIVIFDGDCSLCGSIVTRLCPLLKEDGVGFVASQDSVGVVILEKLQLPMNPSTLYVIEGGIVLSESHAILALISKFKRPFRYATILRYLPGWFLNWTYNRIASMRYKISKKMNVCDLLDQDSIIDMNHCNWEEIDQIISP